MKAEKVHFTLRFVQSLKAGEEKRYADTEINGLQIWVGRQKITYYLRKRGNGQAHTIKIGTLPGMTLQEAKQSALQKLGALANYNDIEAPSGRQIPKVQDAINYYYTRKPAQAVNKYKCFFKFFAHLNHRPITEIKFEDIEAIHKSLKATPALANMAIKVFCAALHRLCVRLHISYSNPAAGLQYYVCKSRKRYLTKEELPRFFSAVQQVSQNSKYTMACDVILFLLYTGVRRTNGSYIKLEDIDFSTKIWTIPANEYKTRKTQEISLDDAAIAIIEKYRQGRTTGFVFNFKTSIAKRVNVAMKKILDIAQIKDFRVHDLRRTIGTWMLSTGAPIAVVSKKLGHSSIVVTEQVYAHILPEETRKATSIALNVMKRELK